MAGEREDGVETFLFFNEASESMHLKMSWSVILVDGEKNGVLLSFLLYWRW